MNQKASPTFRWSLLLKGAVAAILMVLILRQIDWQSFGAVIRHCDPVLLLPLVGVMVFDRLIMAWKWTVLLRGMHAPLPLGRALQLYFLGGLVGLGVQWQIGGDIARAGALGRDTGKTKIAFVSVVIERLTGLAALGLIAMASTVMLNIRLRFAPQGLITAIALVGAVTMACLPFAITSKWAVQIGLRVAANIPLQILKRNFHRLLTECSNYEGLSGSLIVFFVATIVEQSVPVISIWLLGCAFSVPVSLYVAVTIMPLVSFLSRLPISLESFGLREGLYIYFFGLVGIGAADSFALALAARCISYLVIGMGGVIAIWLRRSNTSQFLTAVEKMDEPACKRNV